MAQTQSEACCNTPAVKGDWKEKGTYIEIDGRQVYHTGPSTATSAIFVVYDIFGFTSQTLQGADLLAHADDSKHQYQVFIPDFFKGDFANVNSYPPSTEEQKSTFQAWWKKNTDLERNSALVPKLVDELNKKAGGSIKTWGAIGYCWGGKIVSLSSQEGTPFTAVAEVHPARVDPKDAEKIKIPICMLASGEEDKDAVSGFKDNLKGEHHVETFEDQVHGWMAARADLKDERVKSEYERGYKTVLDFFHKHL